VINRAENNRLWPKKYLGFFFLSGSTRDAEAPLPRTQEVIQ
jgi:hypothetical protein